MVRVGRMMRYEHTTELKPEVCGHLSSSLPKIRGRRQLASIHRFLATKRVVAYSDEFWPS